LPDRVRCSLPHRDRATWPMARPGFGPWDWSRAHLASRGCTGAVLYCGNQSQPSNHNQTDVNGKNHCTVHPLHFFLYSRGARSAVRTAYVRRRETCGYVWRGPHHEATSVWDQPGRGRVIGGILRTQLVGRTVVPVGQKYRQTVILVAQWDQSFLETYIEKTIQDPRLQKSSNKKGFV
jgi:hypothetical protein